MSYSVPLEIQTSQNPRFAFASSFLHTSTNNNLKRRIAHVLWCGKITTGNLLAKGRKSIFWHCVYAGAICAFSARWIWKVNSTCIVWLCTAQRFILLNSSLCRCQGCLRSSNTGRNPASDAKVESEIILFARCSARIRMKNETVLILVLRTLPEGIPTANNIISTLARPGVFDGPSWTSIFRRLANWIREIRRRVVTSAQTNQVK